MRFLSVFLIGLVFGLGIAISGMANPAKVLGFFDLAGNWDPSLLFVMGGALITTAIGYAVIFKRQSKPVMEMKYFLPDKTEVDARLVGGSAIFGLGWGITGFCPGGAIPAIGLGVIEPVIFMAALTAGILLVRLFDGRFQQPTHPART